MVQGLGSGTAGLRNGDPVAVASPGVHLNLGIGPGVHWKHKGQTTLGIGAAQFDRLSASPRQQPYRGIAGRLTAGESAVQLVGPGCGVGVVRRAWGDQVGLDPMGPNHLRSQHKGGGEQKWKRGTAHGSSGATDISDRDQPAFQRLSVLRPAWTILAMELTIIDRASQPWPRDWSSEAITRSAAVGDALNGLLSVDWARARDDGQGDAVRVSKERPKVRWC